MRGRTNITPLISGTAPVTALLLAATATPASASGTFQTEVNRNLRVCQ
jgi:hypothetical protein